MVVHKYDYGDLQWMVFFQGQAYYRKLYLLRFRSVESCRPHFAVEKDLERKIPTRVVPAYEVTNSTRMIRHNDPLVINLP